MNDDSFAKDLINSHKKEIPEMWKNSLHEGWFQINNQSKGKIGAELVKKFLTDKGFEVEIISDKGDIIYKKPEDLEFSKAEVKAAKADLEKLKSGFVKEKLWFNQIRNKQSGWSEIFLVGMYPNHWKIWRKDRDLLQEQLTELSCFKTLSHVESDDPDNKNLTGVLLKKNSSVDNFDEWDEIFKNQKGEQY